MPKTLFRHPRMTLLTAELIIVQLPELEWSAPIPSVRPLATQVLHASIPTFFRISQESYNVCPTVLNKVIDNLTGSLNAALPII